MNYTYSLPSPDKTSSRLARGWLLLGIAAIAASGLYSILLVLSRTPILQMIIPWTDFFHTALVVHVDLSVLIWFLSFICCLWTLDKRSISPIIERAALFFAIAGTILISIAPFTGSANPSLNNYVPMLQQTFFIFSLCLFGIGILLKSVSRVLSLNYKQHHLDEASALIRGNDAAALSAVVTLLVLLWSWLSLSTDSIDSYYYELLYWGAGHTLQICYTVMMLVAWLWLASFANIKIALSPRVVGLLLILIATPALFAPLIYLISPIDSPENRLWFTSLMTYAGLFILPLALPIIYKTFSNSLQALKFELHFPVKEVSILNV